MDEAKLEKKIERYIKDHPEVLFSNFIKEQCKDKEFKRLYELENLKTKISMEIYRARKAKQLSQEQLAKKIKMPQANIARIERGDHLPTINTLGRIFHALNEKVNLTIGKKTFVI